MNKSVISSGVGGIYSILIASVRIVPACTQQSSGTPDDIPRRLQDIWAGARWCPVGFWAFSRSRSWV